MAYLIAFQTMIFVLFELPGVLESNQIRGLNAFTFLIVLSDLKHRLLNTDSKLPSMHAVV